MSAGEARPTASHAGLESYFFVSSVAVVNRRNSERPVSDFSDACCPNEKRCNTRRKTAWKFYGGHGTSSLFRPRYRFAVFFFVAKSGTHFAVAFFLARFRSSFFSQLLPLRLRPLRHPELPDAEPRRVRRLHHCRVCCDWCVPSVVPRGLGCLW